MAFVVSRNYRDWYSEYKWLIRREDEALEKARACKRVSASGVRVVDSDKESGFGCHRVAVAESAEGFDFEEKLEPLQFSGYAFRIGTTGEIVEKFDRLELTPDGGMFAVIPELAMAE